MSKTKKTKFDPSATVMTALGVLTCAKETGGDGILRYRVYLGEGGPKDELHCSGVPEWAYNYAAGFETGVHLAAGRATTYHGARVYLLTIPNVDGEGTQVLRGAFSSEELARKAIPADVEELNASKEFFFAVTADSYQIDEVVVDERIKR